MKCRTKAMCGASKRSAASFAKGIHAASPTSRKHMRRCFTKSCAPFPKRCAICISVHSRFSGLRRSRKRNAESHATDRTTQYARRDAGCRTAVRDDEQIAAVEGALVRVIDLFIMETLLDAFVILEVKPCDLSK